MSIFYSHRFVSMSYTENKVCEKELTVIYFNDSIDVATQTIKNPLVEDK